MKIKKPVLIVVSCLVMLGFARAQTGDQYVQQQLNLAKEGNYWAKYNLWDTYTRGKHGVSKSSTAADKWLAELVLDTYLATFEPVGGFKPKTPKEMLDKFNEYCRLRSGKDTLGGASFFRTRKEGDKLVGSFLTATPDQFKAELLKNPYLKLTSVEKVTTKMFVAHEAAKQESL